MLIIFVTLISTIKFNSMQLFLGGYINSEICTSQYKLSYRKLLHSLKKTKHIHKVRLFSLNIFIQLDCEASFQNLFKSNSSPLPGINHYWCLLRNHGRDSCGVRTNDPQVARQTPYPLGHRLSLPKIQQSFTQPDRLYRREMEIFNPYDSGESLES